MRCLLALLMTACCLAAAEDPSVVTTVAENLPWHAPTAVETGPIIGLAHTAGHYREHLVPLHDPETAAPAVDDLPLATHDLLLVTWGLKPSGGYTIGASSVVTEAERCTVTVRCEAPGPDAMVSMALTHPAVLVPVPKRQDLVIRLSGDRAPVGVADFVPTTGGRFTIIDDRPQP